ncbi:MAG: helicase RepA family protein [Pseudomonadota bacterium]|nr:helicase RepA family protein [Pseudomonadota bacterium]
MDPLDHRPDETDHSDARAKPTSQQQPARRKNGTNHSPHEYGYSEAVDSPELRAGLRKLAEASEVDYDLVRDGIAQDIGVHVLTLDRMVERARGAMVEPCELLPKSYCRIDPRTIAPRPFVYARHYAKGYVSATVAPGGGGKSSFGIVEAISMALGRCLFTGESIRYGPMRVWYLALEDPEDEMMRKIEAVCLHYGVNESLPNLYLHSGRDRPVCVAVEMRAEGGMVSVVARPDVEGIIRECKRTAMDAIIVDPSVSSHQVSENDPVKQEKVMSLWRGIAEDAAVAVEIQHHSRKLNGQEITIDDVRGATSIVNVARSTRLMAPMSGADAEELGVEDDRRGYYFCVVNGKANFMPKAKDRKWYEFHSVCLGNETPQFEADNVGVVERWQSAFEKQTKEEKRERAQRSAQEDADQVWRYLRSELQIGTRYSKKQLEDIRDVIAMGRNEIRAAMALLEAQNRVVPEKRPEEDKRRGSGTYLHPVD